MIVIPAIDLLDGKVVRLHKGSYDEVTVYNESAFKQAEEFKNAGFHHIHIVDLNGAKEGRFVNIEHIRKIINELGMSVQTGGGIRSFEDIEFLIENGIQKVICSSLAVNKPDEWLKAIQTYTENCILGMDLKGGKIAYAGWLETSDEPIDAFLAPMIEAGLKEVLCTDISKDGTLAGPNTALYKEFKLNFPNLSWIASGGVSSMYDLVELDKHQIDAVVVGKAFYEGRIKLDEMRTFND